MSGCIRVGVTEAALNPDYANVCGNRGGGEVSGRFGEIRRRNFFLYPEKRYRFDISLIGIDKNLKGMY